jgi:hypothetical protein
LTEEIFFNSGRLQTIDFARQTHQVFLQLAETLIVETVTSTLFQTMKDHINAM